MSWDAARVVLDTQFKTLPGYDETRVQWPNRIFTKPSDGMYYKVDFLPASNDPEMGGQLHEKGIYQVSIYARSKGGIGSALRAAGAVVSLFDRVRLSNLFCFPPVVAPYISEPDWLHVPVSVPFQVL